MILLNIILAKNAKMYTHIIYSTTCMISSFPASSAVRVSGSAAIVISVRRRSTAHYRRFAAETLVFCGACASCCLKRFHQKAIKRHQPKSMHDWQHAFTILTAVEREWLKLRPTVRVHTLSRYHRLNGSSSLVLTASSLSYGKTNK